MRALIAGLCLLAGAVGAQGAAAQDFSAGSEAADWGLYAEVKARFEATVVDPLCLLTGDCPADCGGGTRQLGLLRTADSALVMVLKNNQPVFSGGSTELQPFCGAAVEVDGLLIDDPDLGASNVYQVQKIRRQGAADWTTANRWTSVWAERNPQAAGPGPWFRRDPRVKAAIAEAGYLGLGLEVDTPFIAEWLK